MIKFHTKFKKHNVPSQKMRVQYFLFHGLFDRIPMLLYAHGCRLKFSVYSYRCVECCCCSSHSPKDPLHTPIVLYACKCDVSNFSKKKIKQSSTNDEKSDIQVATIIIIIIIIIIITVMMIDIRNARGIVVQFMHMHTTWVCIVSTINHVCECNPHSQNEGSLCGCTHMLS